jgi:16S rRNA processing protein RimM
VLLTLVSDRPGRLDPGSVLATSDEPGAPTVEVRSARRHQDKWLVQLVGITTREQADLLRGTVLYGSPDDRDDADDDTLWVHQVVGATVVTPDGEAHGVVANVVPNAASDLLELDSGALVPAIFVTDKTGLPDRLVVDPPDGLFDL